MLGTNTNESTTRTNRCSRSAGAALALAAGLAIGTAFGGTASAQDFYELVLLADMQELRPVGISATGAEVTIPFKAIKEHGVQVYESAGVWTGGDVFLAQNPIGGDGLIQDLVSIQYRPMAARGQTIPGVDIIVKKTPSGKAMYWDTRGSDEGVLVDLDNSLGAASWPGGLNADGSLITGAVYGDLDGTGEPTRAAVRWVNAGLAELLTVPGDSQHSEVFGTSLGGTSVGCYKAIREQGFPSTSHRMIPSEGAHGVIWRADGSYRVIAPSIAGADSASIVLTAISDGGGAALATISTTRSNSKGGLIADPSGNDDWIEEDLDFTLLDAGDINGDGQIDLMDDHDSAALALSADGSVIGGSVTLFGQTTAALWLKDSGGTYVYHDVGTFLSGIGSTGQDGWTLLEVTGVSADGSMITGVGVNPIGQTTGWYAPIPSPGALSLLGLGGLLASRRRR